MAVPYPAGSKLYTAGQKRLAFEPVSMAASGSPALPCGIVADAPPCTDSARPRPYVEQRCVIGNSTLAAASTYPPNSRMGSLRRPRDPGYTTSTFTATSVCPRCHRQVRHIEPAFHPIPSAWNFWGCKHWHPVRDPEDASPAWEWKPAKWPNTFEFVKRSLHLVLWAHVHLFSCGWRSSWLYPRLARRLAATWHRPRV